MSLFGLEFDEELPKPIAKEFAQFVAALNTAFASRAEGTNVGLVFGLEFAEQYDPVVRNEFEQLVAAVQTAFGSQARSLSSVIRGTIPMGSGMTSASVTIPAVNTSLSRLRLVGVTSDDTGVTNAVNEPRIALTNSTTITATRRSGTATNLIVAYELSQYYPEFIQSIQRGSITLSNLLSATATINAVNPATSEVDYLGFETADPNNDCSYARVTLTNPTTVTASRTAQAAGAAFLGYQVVEFR